MKSFATPTGRQQTVFYQFPNGRSNGAFNEFGYGFEPEFISILEYAISRGYLLPSFGWQIKSNRLIYEWKVSGVWSELDCFYNFYTDADRNFALINWKNLLSQNGVEGTNWSFNPLIGFSNNPSAGTAISLMNFSTGGIKFTQSDSSIFGDVDLLPSIGSCDIFGINSTPPRYLLSTFGNGYISCFDNPETGSNSVSIDKYTKAKTFHQLSRQADTFKRYFANGKLIITTSGTTAGAISNLTLDIGITKGQGRPIATYSCMGGGSSMSGKESALFNAWNRYKL